MAAEGRSASRESKPNVRLIVAIGVDRRGVRHRARAGHQLVPVQASGEAKKIDTLWDVLLIASVPVFVLVQTIVLYCVWKFRMRPGEELKDGPPIHGNTRLEVVWTAIPAILLVGLCTYAYVALHDIEKAAGASRCTCAWSASSSPGPSTTPARPAGKEVTRTSSTSRWTPT